MMATKKMDHPSEIEKVISAIRDREVDSTVPAPDQIKIRNLRHGLQKQLAPIFERAGLDVEEINRILRQHHQDLRKLVEERKSQAGTHRAARAEKMRAALAHRSSVLNSIANPPGNIWNVSPIQEAWFIIAEPGSMLTSSTIGPQNNWAQIAYQDSQDTSGKSVYLWFFFQWENPFPGGVVLAASTNLGASGEIWARANFELFSRTSAEISLWATLDAYVGGVDINYPMGQNAIGSPDGESTGPFSGISWAIPEPIFNYNYLCCQPIPVDAGQAAVFVVSMRADIKINDGWVDLDFSSNDGFVMCPEITLQLLSGGPTNAPP
jgi:hypothetical protein